jgi:hypothetical protein
MQNYSSAVYVSYISEGKSRSWDALPDQIGSIGILPEEIDMAQLSGMLAEWQTLCFKDDDVVTNKKRIESILKDPENPSIVAMCVSDDGRDAGSATLQYAEHEPGVRAYWLNEVCRYKNPHKDASQESGGNTERPLTRRSPVIVVIEALESYVSSKGHKYIYLMVEDKPEHGDPSFLISYYSSMGFKVFAKNKGGYTYMTKKLVPNSTTSKKRPASEETPPRYSMRATKSRRSRVGGKKHTRRMKRKMSRNARGKKCKRSAKRLSNGATKKRKRRTRRLNAVRRKKTKKN